MPKDIAPPARGFSFKDFSLSKPGQALPGDRLDTELDRLAGKFGDLEDFLLTSFERDGSLKGSTVAQRHLKPDVFAPVMRRIDDLIQKARQDLDQREKSTQNLATEALTARTQAKTAAQEAQDAVQEAKSLNQQAQTSAQNANQARARSEAALIPLANLQSDAQTAANSARIAEDMAYRWAEKTDGPVFVPNGGDPVDDGFYSSKFWALFTQTNIENGSFWYLGSRTTPPTTGNDGLPLQPGMWYFNTDNGQTFIWNGTAWDPISGAVGTVLSVFGRQGAVQAQANDYAAFYLRLSGGTLTGQLTLSASPTALLHAATKGYVDQQDTAYDQAVRAYVDQQDAALNTSLRAYADAQVATRLPLIGGQMQGQIKSVGFPVAPEDLGSKGYIDTKVATEVATRLTQAQADALYLKLSGGTLTGPLTLPQAPTADLHASTKKYVDDKVGAITFPPGTAVGPSAPASPAPGQLWYSTVEPVGLFIWYADADSSQWVQIGGGSGQVTDGTPIGTVSFFAANAPPPGWLVCNNQRVTTAYPELRQYLLDAGSPYGVAGTDPRVPELRGEFIRGHVGGRTGVDAGRVFGSAQVDELRSHTHSVIGQVVDGSIPGGTSDPSAVAGNRFRNTTTNATGGAETRPRNVALLPCIKAFDTLRVEGSAEFNIATDEQVRDGTSTDTLLTPANVSVLRDQLVAAALAAGPALTTTFAQAMSVSFVAEHARMQAFCAVGVAHSGTTSADFNCELRLRNITTGVDIKVISGGESAATGLGFACRFPMNMTYTDLVVGDTYEMQIWLRRGAGSGAGTFGRDMSIDARVFP